MTVPTPVPGRSATRSILAVSALVLAVEVGASLWAGSVIPAGARVPTHWGIDGRVDGWSSKEWALWFTPVLTVGVAALLVVLPRFEPRRTNLMRSGTAYAIAIAGVLVLLAGIHVASLVAATGRSVPMGRVAVVGVGALFALLGSLFGRIRSNFMFGVRTPWTLSSERSWAETHRLMGRLWLTLGGLLVVLALAGLPEVVLFVTLFVGIGATLVVAFAYSYVVWSRDPDRQQLGH